MEPIPRRRFYAAVSAQEFIVLQRQTEQPLYQQLAGRVADDIRAGVFAAGSKVPSVRKLAGQYGVSISTVTQAYAWLEDQGWISARPQSGYFVRSHVSSAEQQIPPLSAGDKPSAVTKAEFINGMLAKINRPAMINLGAAIPRPDWLPQRVLQTHIQKVSRFHSAEVFDYLFSPGLEELRNQVAVRMRDVNVRCQADDVVITHGCAEALALCLRAVTNPGDLIAVESPCYYGFLQTADMLGLKIIEIPTDPQQGMSVDALQLALQQWPVKVIQVSSRYSNPTGCSMPVEQQKKLMALASQYQVPVIEDDVYGETGYPVARGQAQPPASVLKTYDQDGLVLYCSSFSKTVSAGLRVGWCIPGRWYRQVTERQTFTTFSAASLSQYAMLSYLQNGHYDRHLRQFRVRAANSMQRFIHAIRQYFPPGTRVSEPAGGFILWVCLPEGVSAMDLHYEAAQRSVIIIPGDVFSNTEHFSNYIRINTAITWSEDVEDAIKILAQLVKKQQQKYSGSVGA
ncbi:MAG: GntR family transcriptional regulator [Oceanospirillaceae bacterium]|nr:GntR family transcriptional regulator [Oceanospirillaceae bacterium]